MKKIIAERGRPLLCPSILSADFADLARSVAQVRPVAPILHCDIMDGHFVPNLSFGPQIVAALRRHTDQVLDVHLMTERPEDWLSPFAAAGADTLVIHQEVAVHAIRHLTKIRELGCLAGISLNPGTPLDTVDELLPCVDLVLIMSVNPGFGGQKFIPQATDRIRRLRRKIDERGLDILIQVDGGIDVTTAREVTDAGADLLVAGSAVFGQKDPLQAAKAILAAARGEEAI
jgi:ribulose-phosphate 3-epimerase